MPTATISTVTAAMTAAAQLADLRRAHAQAAAEAIAAERSLNYERARAEHAIIRDVADGDEKKLGANEDARRRAFTLVLELEAGYVDARTAHADALADRNLYEIDARLVQDQLTILVAALQAGLTDLPADLFADADCDAPADILITRPVVQAVTVSTADAAAGGGA